MSDEIINTLDNYIRQARSLHSQVQSLRTRFKTPVDSMKKDLLGEVGGAVGEALLESAFGRKWGRKITKGVVAQKQKEQLVLERQRIETSFSTLLDSVSTFLSTVSVRKTRLPSEGNSHLLLRKISKIRGFVRLETRIKKTIATLEGIRTEPLIYNRDISQWLEKERVQRLKKAKPYETLKKLETNLRSFIHSKLATVSQNWWKDRIPADVRKRAEERKAKNETQWPWHKRRDLHPIYYVDFTDYMKIIIRKDNWKQVFAPFFWDKDIISAKLRELEPIRNAIAHFRELNEDEQEKLKLYCKDILASLQKEEHVS